MKNLKMIIVLIVLFAPVISIAQQGNRGGGMRRFSVEQRAQMRTDSLKAILNLNDEQVKKIEIIQTEKFQKMDSVRNTSQQVRQQRQAAIMTSNQKYDNEILKVLNEEQKVKFQEYRSKQMAQMQNRRNNNVGQGNRGNRGFRNR